KTLNELLLSTPKPVQQLQAKTTTPPPNHLASNNRQVVKTTDITRVNHEATTGIQQDIEHEVVMTNYDDRVSYPLKIDTSNSAFNFLGFIMYAGVGFNWNSIDVDINNNGSSK